MKQLTCEMCGGHDLMKQDGCFICQTCGTKYSVEEAKKMMIEGTVSVQGTVKIERNDELQKILKNAAMTLEDKHFKEAYDLYTQALSIDPENTEAMISRMGCSMCQGTVEDTKIDELDSTIKRALQIEHNKYGESKTFFDNSTQAIYKGNSLLANLFMICRNYFEENYNSNKNAGIAMGAASLLLGGGLAGVANVVGQAGKMAQLEQTMNKTARECFNASLNICNFVLDDIKDYRNSSEAFWDVLFTIKENLGQYVAYVEKGNKDNALNIINDINDKLNTTKEKAIILIDKTKKEAMEKYWNEHQDDKKKLEEKKGELMSKKNDFEHKKESNEKIKSKTELKNNIAKLEIEKSKLGMFKGKEKAEIQSKIDEIYNQISSISDEIEHFNKEMDVEIEIIDKELKEINDELEMDRR